jgi:intracellular septation protein
MRLLFDFFPILLFFVAYKFYGIYVATAITMAASCLQVAVYWVKHRKFEPLHIITLILVVILGTTTLWLHNELYIKWKPTAIYWFFALFFLVSQFVGKKPVIQRLLGKQVQLPTLVWQKLNISWILFFIIMGTVNIYVLYHFSTNAWVNFKLFGTLAMTVVFMIIQAIYMSKHLNKHNPNDSNTFSNSEQKK